MIGRSLHIEHTESIGYNTEGVSSCVAQRALFSAVLLIDVSDLSNALRIITTCINFISVRADVLHKTVIIY